MKFGMGCCCGNSNFCCPHICLNFYDPNTGNSTKPDNVFLNDFSYTQWGSGHGCTVGFPYPVIVEFIPPFDYDIYASAVIYGYQPGSLIDLTDNIVFPPVPFVPPTPTGCFATPLSPTQIPKNSGALIHGDCEYNGPYAVPGTCAGFYDNEENTTFYLDVLPFNNRDGFIPPFGFSQNCTWGTQGGCLDVACGPTGITLDNCLYIPYCGTYVTVQYGQPFANWGNAAPKISSIAGGVSPCTGIYPYVANLVPCVIDSSTGNPNFTAMLNYLTPQTPYGYYTYGPSGLVTHASNPGFASGFPNILYYLHMAYTGPGYNDPHGNPLYTPFFTNSSNQPVNQGLLNYYGTNWTQYNLWGPLCINQQLAMCNSNNLVMANVNSYGAAFWAGLYYQYCPTDDDCCGENIVTMASVPIQNMNVSASVDYVYTISDGITHCSGNASLNGEGSVPIIMWTQYFPGDGGGGGNAPALYPALAYSTSCQGASISFPCSIWEQEYFIGFPTGPAIKQCNVSAAYASVGLGGDPEYYTQPWLHGVPPGVQVTGIDQSPNGSAMITFSPWDCQNIGAGNRIFCSNPAGTFAGWSANNAPNGCENFGGDDPQIYYYGVAPEITLQLTGTGDIDLCNGTIYIELEYEGNVVGVMNL